MNAYAQEPRNWQESWYIGGSIGQSKLTPDGGTQWHVTDDTSGTKKLYTGVNVTKDTSLEAFWADLGDADLKSSTQTGSINYKAIGVAGVYKPPINIAGIRPLGKLGIARFTTKDKGTISSKQLHDNSLFLGLGAEYALTHNINLRAEYERYDKDIKQYSLGVNWRPLQRNHRNRVEKVTISEPVPTQKIMYAPPTPVVIKQPKPPVVVVQKPRYLPAPVAKKPVMQVIHSSLSGGSNFNTASSQLTPRGENELQKIAHDLQSDGMKVRSIQITGHTDNVGDNASNQSLSLARANSVADFLVGMGIKRHLMRIDGKGETQPIATNQTETGRAQNRRVKISIKGMRTVVKNH